MIQQQDSTFPNASPSSGGFRIIVTCERGLSWQSALQGETVDDARLSAAVLYAHAMADDDPPTGFVIVEPGGAVVYRFNDVGRV